jgi:hypothetical protein
LYIISCGNPEKVAVLTSMTIWNKSILCCDQTNNIMILCDNFFFLYIKTAELILHALEKKNNLYIVKVSKTFSILPLYGAKKFISTLFHISGCWQ